MKSGGSCQWGEVLWRTNIMLSRVGLLRGISDLRWSRSWTELVIVWVSMPAAVSQMLFRVEVRDSERVCRDYVMLSVS